MWENPRSVGSTQPNVQGWSLYMHFNVKGFKIFTLHSNFQTFFCNTSFSFYFWYWLFCIEYEHNVMSHYIEEVHATKWCTKIIYVLYIMHLIIIQLQRQSPPVFGRFPSVKGFSPIYVFHWKTAQWHSHQCIQCFRFQSNFAITLHPILFGNSTLTYSCACQAKVVVSAKSELQELLESGSVC